MAVLSDKRAQRSVPRSVIFRILNDISMGSLIQVNSKNDIGIPCCYTRTITPTGPGISIIPTYQTNPSSLFWDSDIHSRRCQRATGNFATKFTAFVLVKTAQSLEIEQARKDSLPLRTRRATHPGKSCSLGHALLRLSQQTR